MSNIEIPKEGDYLIFNRPFTAVRGSWSYYEIEKGTIARVAYRTFNSSSGTDEVDCNLVLGLNEEHDMLFFNFNYSVHKNLVSVIPDTKAASILYDRSKV